MDYMQEANAIAERLRHSSKQAARKPRWTTMPPAGKRRADLTPIQIEMLDYMREYLQENDQLPPVVAVADRFEMNPNGAQWHLAEMARKGALEKNAAGRWRFARGKS